MKRRIAGALLAAALLLTPAGAMRTVPVQVDGAELDAVCYLEDGVTYVPLEAILSAFGTWRVSWSEKIHSAVAVSGGQRVLACPGGSITVNGHRLPCKVFYDSAGLYVPLRLLTEALRGKVVWDRRLRGAAVTSPGAEYDAEELYWLSHIISAESRGEPFAGQIAVGNVVLNRVACENFPDTVSAVIFDDAGAIQFEPVGNGTVYQTPSPESVEAAKRALDGENTAGEAMFFYAPALSQGLWINENRDYALTIGGHRFYR